MNNAPQTALPKSGGIERIKLTRGDSLREQLLTIHEEWYYKNSNPSEGVTALNGLEKQAAENLKGEKEVGELLKDRNIL